MGVITSYSIHYTKLYEYDWSLGFNSYGIDNGIWEIKASATGFESSYTEDSVYVLINNSGDGIGATPLYAYYAEGSEYIIVKFSEPIEIIDSYNFV